MSKQAVFTPQAPRPVAPYSQAVRKANILALAGQGGFDTSTHEPVGPGVGEPTRQTPANLPPALGAAGATGGGSRGGRRIPGRSASDAHR